MTCRRQDGSACVALRNKDRTCLYRDTTHEFRILHTVWYPVVDTLLCPHGPNGMPWDSYDSASAELRVRAPILTRMLKNLSGSCRSPISLCKEAVPSAVSYMTFGTRVGGEIRRPGLERSLSRTFNRAKKRTSVACVLLRQVVPRAMIHGCS